MRRNPPAPVLLLASIILVAACGASTATPSVESATSTSPSREGAGADDPPAPVAAWELHGDGLATTGGVLTFTGVHEFSEEDVVLDGRTAYGATSGSGPLETKSSFSAAAWLTIAREAEFASVPSQVGNVAAAFFLGTGDGVWSFAMKDLDTNDPGHTIRALAEPPVVDPDTWVHLVGVFDGDAGEIRLFIDGELAAATSFDGPWHATGPLAVGAAQAHGAPSDFWPGAVAHAAVYQAALAADDIARLHESTRPTTKPPLLTVLPDPGTYAGGMLDGTWDYQVSEDEVEFLASTFSPQEAAAVGIPGADTKVRVGLLRKHLVAGSGRGCWR